MTTKLLPTQSDEPTQSITSSIKQIAKITDDTPHRMRPTIRSITLQIIVTISAATTSIIYAFYYSKIQIFYPVAFTWIIVGIIAAYIEIDFNAYKLSMTSFRGFVICVSLIANLIIDIVRHYVCTDDYPVSMLSTIIDNIIWILVVNVVLAADSAPRITNFVRLIGPLSVLAFILWFV